jgi:hypothetical protein
MHDDSVKMTLEAQTTLLLLPLLLLLLLSVVIRSAILSNVDFKCTCVRSMIEGG